MGRSLLFINGFLKICKPFPEIIPTYLCIVVAFPSAFCKYIGKPLSYLFFETNVGQSLFIHDVLLIVLQDNIKYQNYCSIERKKAIYLQKEKDLQAADRSGTADGFIHSQPEPQPSGAGRSDRKKNGFLHPPAEEKQTPFRLYPILKFLLVSVF